MPHRTLELIDPADLTIHPDLKHDHRLEAESAGFLSLVEDIRANGVRDALHVDDENRVVDGRHRLWAAKQLKLANVPCVRVARDCVATTIVSAILNRRHYTKGQRAYVVVKHLDGAFREGITRRLNSAVAKGNTATQIAEQWGLSPRLVEQARTLHKKFTETPELRAEWEPKLMDEDAPVGLGHAIAGIGGETSTKDKPKRTAEQIELFGEAFDVLGKRFVYWTRFDEADKAAVQPKLRHTVAAMPADLRDALKKAIVQVEREEKTQA
jgi:hypothetical protein